MKKTGASSRIKILAVCLFAFIWGAKVGVVDRYGSDIPNWDQWDAEGDQLLLPYLKGELTLANIIRPHNEHRVALTRILTLGLTVINGQWDARLECAVNALLHAGFAVGCFLFGCRLLPRGWQTAWLITVAVLVAPPHAWQNATSGFASQQYLLLGLSTFGIGLLILKKPWTVGWWLGVVFAGLALFTMASGLLAAAAVLLTLSLFALRHRCLSRNEVITMVACGTIVLAGLLLYTPFPGHASLKASSLNDFLLTFWRSLQWPAVTLPLFPLFAWLPFIGLAVESGRRGRLPDRRELVVLAAGIWVLLQFGATAYARGANAPFPSSRYLDTILLGIGVVALSGLVLINKYPVSERFRVARVGALGVWMCFMIFGLWSHLVTMFQETLPAVRSGLREREVSTRAFLWTNDVTHLSGREIPYPSARDLVDRLATEEIRAVLPASIRLPEKLSGAAAPPGSFVLGGVPAQLDEVPPSEAWGSFDASGASSTGTWTSAPIRSEVSRWLRFELAGSSETDKVSFTVTSTDENSPRRFFASALRPDRWNTIYVPASKQPTTVVASDQDPDGWIAFTAPTEMTRLSYWTAAICHQGFLVASAALLLATATLIFSSMGPRRADSQ